MASESEQLKNTLGSAERLAKSAQRQTQHAKEWTGVAREENRPVVKSTKAEYDLARAAADRIEKIQTSAAGVRRIITGEHIATAIVDTNLNLTQARNTLQDTGSAVDANKGVHVAVTKWGVAQTALSGPVSGEKVPVTAYVLRSEDNLASGLQLLAAAKQAQLEAVNALSLAQVHFKEAGRMLVEMDSQLGVADEHLVVGLVALNGYIEDLGQVGT